MKISLSFVRTFFVCLSLLFAIVYTTATLPGGLNFTNTIVGAVSGLVFSALLILADYLLKGSNLRTLNILLVGLMAGYLLGEGVLLIWQKALTISGVELMSEQSALIQAIMFFTTVYFGVILAVKASEEFYLSIPFVKFKSTAQKKKNLLMDWAILSESRILDLASLGLLDDYLIMPNFVLKDLYFMSESTDENVRTKAKRCLEMLKKIEAIPGLDLRYSEIDFPDTTDSSVKLIRLARQLDAHIITADPARFQQSSTEAVRIVNLQMLSNVLKPITGEMLHIKIQRFGKEPRQGVGYLDDGTMVVVNGGAEFIGATIRAHVLSVKHTTSGRMIFCNVAEESLEPSNGVFNHVLQETEKSYNSIV